METVPDDLWACLKDREERSTGVEWLPPGVIEVRARVGGIVAGLDEPGHAEIGGLAQLGGVKGLRAQATRSEREREQCQGCNGAHAQGQTREGAASHRAHETSSQFQSKLPFPQHRILAENLERRRSRHERHRVVAQFEFAGKILGEISVYRKQMTVRVELMGWPKD